MKKYNLILVLITVLGVFTTETYANDPDRTFNYQGQLNDNGSPVTGFYDITVQGFISEIDTGGIFIPTSEHLNVNVSKGLFMLENVSLTSSSGFDPFFDGKEIYLEISVRAVGSATYQILSPRQQLHSVPYANNITSKGANDGQVLTFYSPFENGEGEWIPRNPSSNWSKTGGNISYNSSGGVRIGGVPTSSIPVDGLVIEGDVKQDSSSNGMMKYMVNALCGSTTTLNRSYNGTATVGAITATNPSSGNCRLNFPTDISNRFWYASTVDDAFLNFDNPTVSCHANSSSLNCHVEDKDGAPVSAEINVLIF